MTVVYVDDMRPVIRNRNWPYNQACHMVADSVRELHIFARKIGLKRNWFQPTTLPHYDLTPNKRAQAVRLGAKEIPRGQLVEMIHINRKGNI